MKRFSSVFVSAFASATLLSGALFAQETKKVVLLEQYTGAWCGWCVEGTTFMNDLEKEYGDRFIGVKIHYGDDMQNNTIWSQFNSSVSGFPSGSADRAVIGGKVVIDRGQWKSAVAQRLSIEPSVDVQVKSFAYDPITREATVTVTSKILKDVTGDLRFSMYIVEDSVSGTGQGYDQQNYLSGNANFKTNEYYSKPKVITGYQHMSVVRDILGGVFGQEGSIPSGREVGSSYEYTFKYTLPVTYKAWHTKAVLSVYKYRSSSFSQNEILNAIETDVFSNLPRYTVTDLDENFGFSTQSGMVSENSTSEKTIEIKNVTNEPTSFYLSILNKSSLPKEWNVSLKENTILVGAGETKKVNVDFSTNGLASCQPVEVAIVPVKEGTQGIPSSETFWVLSENAKSAVFFGAASNVLAMSSMNALQKIDQIKSNAVFIPLIPNAMKSFDYSKLDIGVFDLGQSAIDFKDVEGTSLDAIKQLLDNNKKVYITGERLFTNNQEDNVFTQEATDFFEKTLGVSLSEMKQRYSGNTLISFNIDGIDKDPIGDGISVEANNAASAGNPTYSLFTESLYLMPNTKSVPILYFDGDKEAVAGVRMEDGSKRVVFLGFNPMCIANVSTRERLIADAYTWLMNGSTSDITDEKNGIDTYVTPNPASGSNITLSFGSQTESSVTINIINALGQLVNSFTADVHNGSNNLSLDITKMNSGTYTATTNVGGVPITIPFVIAR